MQYLSRLALAFVVFVVLLASGCDCAGPAPTRRCTASVECGAGQICRDSMCRPSSTVDGDTDLDSSLPGTDTGPVPMPVSLRIDPVMADLVSIDGAVVTQTFSVFVVYDTGFELPAMAPRFEIDTRT